MGTCSCGKKTDYFGPDPYQSEINGDETPYWICDGCYIESSMDI